MRFKLILAIEGGYRKLPINYQYELSAFVYQTLQKGDNELASWLHENGFILDGKQFKLFTFSNFVIPQYEISGDRITVKSDTISWYISFLPEVSTEVFIKGLFSGLNFKIGDNKSSVQFSVKNIELLPPPVFLQNMIFKTYSPICISRKNENNKIDYINPSDSYAKGAILKNILNKYRAFYGKEYENGFDFDFILHSEPKAKLILIKAGKPEQTKIKGYKCIFEIKAPTDLIKIMYDSGIGEKGSLGFGFLEVK